MPLEINMLLKDRYRIEATIASGGMGAIYRAKDETLGILVAVKENFFTTEEFSLQFRREAIILAGLRHPNLPRVTDHFVVPGTGQYLVMDYIEGSDLRELINHQGSLPSDIIVQIGVTICDALEYLHTRVPAIVHRDIKPGNIKITPNGKIFLVDFGLAKFSRGEATAIGAQALTPGYAPPEQYGQGTEPRSDLYSLGATLYVALTGNIPADGLSRMMGEAALNPIRTLNPQAPSQLAGVIEKSMMVHLEQRFQTAGEFKKALISAAPNIKSKQNISAAPPTTIPLKPSTPRQNVIRQTSQVQQPAYIPIQAQDIPSQPAYAPPQVAPRLKSKSLIYIVTALIVAVILFGTGALLAAPRILNSLQKNTSSGATETQTISSQTPIAELPVALSPTVVIIPSPTQVEIIAASPTLPNTPVLTTETQPAPPTEAPTLAATSIGGGPGQIAFSANRDGTVQIWLSDLNGNTTQVTHLPDGACQPDWSPDGKRIVFTSPCTGPKDDYPGSSLYLINADGTGLVPLASLPGGDFDPAWSPDGTQIAFTTLRDNGVPHLYLYTLADNTVTCLSKIVNYERQPAWSPDGSLLAYQTSRQGQPQIWLMSRTGENAKEFSSLEGSFEWKPAWAPDASILVYSQGNPSQLVARQIGNAQAKEFPLSDKIRPAEGVDFSPDGWYIVFESKQDNNQDIYYMLKNGSGLTRLTDDPGNDFHPAWRPDQPSIKVGE